jgi:hypothetical protein
MYIEKVKQSIVMEENIMTIAFNRLNKNVSKQNLLFNQILFHCKMVLIIFFCSLASIIYAQTDYTELEWVRKYSGSFKESIIMPKVFTIDDYGTSYVAIDEGYYLFSDSSSHSDYVILEYDSNGGERPILRYSPSIDSMNQVTQMAIDKFGNIYLAGYADYGGYYKTLKYSSDDNLLWNATECSGGMFGGGRFPTGLAIDDSGNVFMSASTGQIYKYNSNGEKIWSVPSEENFNSSMVLDSDANIYILRSGRIVKYNSDSVKQWDVTDTIISNGGIILLDPGRNIYIGGLGLAKYSAEGEPQWAAASYSYSGNNITLDNTGNAIICEPYISTVKFDSKGTLSWEKSSYAGLCPVMYPPSIAICTDRFDNIYVAGSARGENGSCNIAIIKYNADGEEKWVVQYYDTVKTDRKPIAIKVDTLGNIFVTGLNMIKIGELHDNEAQDDEQPEVITLKYKQPNYPTFIKPEEMSANTVHLFSNYPNPFNPSTTIRFSISKRSFISLCVCDLLGRKVADLVNEELRAGTFETVFTGAHFSSGIYFYRLRALPVDRQGREFIQTRKFVMLK